MSVYKFELHEYNYQNNPGNQQPHMDKMSGAGWWVEASNIAFPYVYILWKRPVGDDGEQAQAAEADHTKCTEAQAALAAERDQARDVARALNEQKTAQEAQIAQLNQQLADAQKVTKPQSGNGD